jgi:putative hydrolase of the HAD superfamily
MTMRWLHDGIRAVYFDAVGTLLFPTPGALDVYRVVAQRRGLALSPQEIRTRFLAAYHTQEVADAQAGWVTCEEREHTRWRRIVTETLQGVDDVAGCFTELFEHFGLPSAWTMNADAPGVLRDLAARGIVLGMGSNYDSRLWRVLDGFPELAMLRPRVLVSASVGHRKPSSRFFAAVCEQAACRPECILFVGDDVDNDYDGAATAGLQPLLLGDTQRERAIATLAELTRE